ncbi:MAG TPA: hypothetical protein VII74_06510, partial [Chthoniobacterales bacterium]
MIALTEKLLSTAGGWQAMKAARELVKAGRVGEATYEPPILRGEVREGGKNYRAGLRIRSATDVENLCTCRESRDRGQVCAHSLAVGLAVLAPPPAIALAPAPAKAESKFHRTPPAEIAPVALHVIFPPNFPNAWAKGQIMICIEAERDGHRAMLDALPSASLDDHDFALVERLPHGMNTLSAAEFLELLPILRGHPRITFGRGKSVRVAENLRRPRFVVKERGPEDFLIAAEKWPNEFFLVAGDGAWSLRDQEFAEIGTGLPPGLTTALREPVKRGPEFFALELALWREGAEVVLPAGMKPPLIAAAEPEFTLKLEGSLQHLRATLTCRYGERPPFPPTAEPEKTFAFRDAKNPDRLILRNLAAEAAAVARLAAAGFVENELRDPARAARFFAFDYPALANEWQVTVAPSLGKAHASLEPVAPQIEIVSSGEDWFELRYTVASAEGEHIPLAEVQRLLRSGQTRMRLKNGKQAVFDP